MIFLSFGEHMFRLAHFKMRNAFYRESSHLTTPAAMIGTMRPITLSHLWLLVILNPVLWPMFRASVSVCKCKWDIAIARMWETQGISQLSWIKIFEDDLRDCSKLWQKNYWNFFCVIKQLWKGEVKENVRCLGRCERKGVVIFVF